MLPADTPDPDTLRTLIEHRAPACVSIVLASSPVPAEHERVRIALRDAIDEAARRLASRTDLSREEREAVLARLRAVHDDPEVWQHQSATLVILADTAGVQYFRLPLPVEESVTVADRFDVRALLAAGTRPAHAFVLQLSQGLVRLTELTEAPGLVEHALDLPDDLATTLRYTTNGGRADREPARGSDGDGSLRAQYARVVDAAVTAVVPPAVPLLLVATDDLTSAYRAQNTHRTLLEDGIHVHPESLDDATLESAARQILAERRARIVSEWKERFGTLRAQGRATSRLSEVAAAAAAAGIDELVLDQDAVRPGSLDEFGVVHGSDGGDFLLLDLAGEVLRTGGRVIAVPRGEMTDGSPVAALLRFPVATPSGS